MKKNAFFKGNRTIAVLIVVLSLSFNKLAAQTGSASSPFTQLGQAQSITSEGVYYFNLSGVTFSTYVKTGGWVQVAIDFAGSTGGSMPQGTSLTNTTRGILSPAALLKLGSATKARIYVSTGQLDVQNTNATILSRIVNNQALHKGGNDNGINTWTGTNTLSASFSAGGCNASSNNGLHQRVIHTACTGTGVHWIPVDNMRQIRNNLGEIPSPNYFQLLVQAPAVAVVNGPTFNTQPSSSAQNICLNGTATTLTTSATGAGTITYQWYRNTSASTTGGTLISGATGTSYSPPTSNAGTTYYYVIATNSQGSTASTLSGAITVSNPSVGGTASSNQTICAGASPTALSLTGSTGSIQWQVSTDNITFITISGATSSPLTSAQMGALTSTRYFRALVTSGTCTATNSNVITVTVTPLPTIASTTPASICGTGTAILAASVTGGTINWYVASSGGSSLGTGTIYTTPSISTTTTYYVDVVANGCTSSPRTAVTATVNSIPSAASNFPSTLEYLVVGGGGGGGFDGAGGGGGGQVKTGSLSSLNSGSYTITIGTGGTNATSVGSQASDGGTSTLNTPTPISSVGGGGGGSKQANGKPGANGGGAGHHANTIRTGGTSTAGGYSGGNNGPSTATAGFGGGGGGGATGAGTAGPAGNGGPGVGSSISGTLSYYGGGGGGGSYNGQGTGVGGIGGGGTGGRGLPATAVATAGAPNTGGGGGGAGEAASNPGKPGGSGIVIIRYAGTPQGTGGTITQIGGYTIHTFTSNGSFAYNGGSASAEVPNMTSCGASAVTFTGTVSTGLTLDWYSAATGGTLLSSGTTSYTTPVLSANTTYYVEVRNISTGCVSASRLAVTATITSASTVSANQSVCDGGTPASDITLSSASGTIQWQSSTNNVSFTNISGQTSATLSAAAIGALTQTTYYRAVVTNGTCIANSPVHAITVDNLTFSTTPSSGDMIWRGATSTDWNTASNWYTYNGTSYVVSSVVPSSGNTVIIPANQTCVLNQPSIGSNTVNAQNITIENGAALSLGSGTLNTTGHFVNNGTLDAGTGTIAFIGDSTQSINGTTATAFYNLTVNNSHTGVYPSHVAVKLDQDATVTNSLTLTDGILDVFDHVLTLGTSAAKATISPALGTTDSYVAAHHNLSHTGYVKQFVHSTNIGTAYGFPVGDDDKWTPFNLTFNTGSSLAAGSFITSNVNDALIPGSNNGAFSNRVVRDWEVEPSAGITTPNYTIEVFHNQDVLELGGNASSSIVPFKLSGGTLYVPSASGVSGASIVNQGTYTSGADSYTWSGLTTFSNFGGTEVITPLPIELVSFQANCKEDNTVAITWTTASEHNTSHYIVEQSRDGQSWSVLGEMAAAGNSTQLLNYEMIDAEKATGTTYYRLTQYDNDGVFEVFNAVTVNCGSDQVPTTITYPNPSGNSFNVSKYCEEVCSYGSIRVFDTRGKLIFASVILLQHGQNVFTIEAPDAAPGVYYIQVSDETGPTYTVKHSLR